MALIQAQQTRTRSLAWVGARAESLNRDPAPGTACRRGQCQRAEPWHWQPVIRVCAGLQPEPANASDSGSESGSEPGRRVRAAVGVSASESDTPAERRRQRSVTPSRRLRASPPQIRRTPSRSLIIQAEDSGAEPSVTNCRRGPGRVPGPGAGPAAPRLPLAAALPVTRSPPQCLSKTVQVSRDSGVPVTVSGSESVPDSSSDRVHRRFEIRRTAGPGQADQPRLGPIMDTIANNETALPRRRSGRTKVLSGAEDRLGRRLAGPVSAHFPSVAPTLQGFFSLHVKLQL